MGMSDLDICDKQAMRCSKGLIMVRGLLCFKLRRTSSTAFFTSFACHYDTSTLKLREWIACRVANGKEV